jgi:ribosomal protein S12 methylthiotransferase
VFEVILIAQDLGDFAKDRKEKNGLAKLLRAILQNKRQFWVRLLYLYPDEIDDELIDVIQSDPRICPYLDMPIQHINDQMLKAMHRTTDKAHILATIANLRTRLPSVSIRTSLMVGFPGETEEQFEELVAFVKKIQLDNVGVFQFSLEKEAYAAKLPGQISEEVKQDRFNRLVKAQWDVVKKKNKKLIGSKFVAIVEGFHPDSKHLAVARHQGQCPDIDNQIILNDFENVKEFGALYEIEITDFADYDLVGKVLRPIKPKASSCKLSLV